MTIFLEYLKISLWMTPILLLALWLLPKISQRYTAKLSYFVWLVIALRLVVPWNFTLPAEKAPLHVDISQETMLVWTPMELSAGQEGEAKGGVQMTPGGMPETENKGTEVPSMTWTPMQVIFIIWLAGVIFSMLPTAASTLHLKKLLRRWEKAPSPETAAFYEKTAGEKRPPLAVSPTLETPMAVGLFHTKIYLPHEEYTQQELEMIFRHELIHWRRKDLWYKFLLLLARSIHWYNPFVWLMAKRANRDLEISCDGEAVKEKDMAYRKAYSRMILQEAERGLQKQAALTTCFTDGKRALQERLVEIMNGKKRKKGMALVAMTLVLALSCGCLVSYGGSDPASAQTDVALVEGIRSMAETWAKALETRDGKPRYEMMSEACKAAFIEEQKGALGDDWNYVIGWSSPWVMSYEVEAKEGTAIITYTMEDSSPSQYVMKELLRFGEENGKLVVVDHFCSNIYWEDGKVHPVVSRSDTELNEGIWDFMYQSVIGFISQSKWGVYELERYTFDIQKIEKERLANGMDEVRVDFALQIRHRNPFCDPDEVEYIKKAKEEGSSHYQELYEGYYEQQEANTTMQFVCQVFPNERFIHEDTCDTDSFRLYTSDEVHPLIAYYNNETPAYLPYYSEEPNGPWYCSLLKLSDENTVQVNRKILIPDTAGRTNNGYFDFYLGYGINAEVAEDAVITLGGVGEEQKKLSGKEWLTWMQENRVTLQDRSFTVVMEQTSDKKYVITAAKEGYHTVFVAENDTAPLNHKNIPSGYPTDSKTITAPFFNRDGDVQHTGIDFSTDGKKIPVRATADGIVTQTEFDAKKGLYVRIDHENGYTTLFSHLSRVDVKLNDVVKKGDVIGITGMTGQATGVHCHYEIQLNGLSQDPKDYL